MSTVRRIPLRTATLLASLGLLLPLAGCPQAPEDTHEDELPPAPQEQGAHPAEAALKTFVVADIPPIHLEPMVPMSGDSVTLSIDVPDATDVVVAFEGPGCGSFVGGSGTSPYSLSGVAAAQGWCHATADVTTPAGIEILEARYVIQANDPILPAVEVPGAIFQDSAVPVPSDDPEAPVLLEVDGPATFLNGTTIDYLLDWETNDDIKGVVVTVEGDESWWLLPLDAAKPGAGDLALHFPADIFDRLDAARDGAVTVTVKVAMLDGGDRLSNFISQTVQGVLVGTGEVQVGIVWNTPTDVDLHVTEPGGDHIYYGNPTSAANGQLDLDSNAGCSIDGVNAENIFWPTGQSPVGDYNARVHMWSNCDVASTSGTITIKRCNEDPIVESFSLGSTGDEMSWDFDSSCAQQVSGKVTYEDFTVGRTTLAAAGRQVPARQVLVQVVRRSDDVVLSDGYTNAAGDYRITFDNDGDPGVYVRVLAMSDTDTNKQEVQALNGELYSWETTETFDETEDSVRENINFEIKKADKAAALNLMDVGLRSHDYARTSMGKALDKVTWKWTEGSLANGNNYSYHSAGSIVVLSSATDPDEYDDPVLAHEFGHFVMWNVSTNNSPNGQHHPMNRVDGRLAWSEGWGTFFGQAALGQPMYVDTTRNAAGASTSGNSWSIETPPTAAGSAHPLGNAGNTMSGNVSEGIVSAVLWDLHDTTNEARDTLSGRDGAIFGSFTKYLRSPNARFADRGIAGRDLVDFVDGWRCLGYGSDGADDTKGLRGNLRGRHSLTYDFGVLASCK